MVVCKSNLYTVTCIDELPYLHETTRCTGDIFISPGLWLTRAKPSQPQMCFRRLTLHPMWLLKRNSGTDFPWCAAWRRRHVPHSGGHQDLSSPQQLSLIGRRWGRQVGVSKAQSEILAWREKNRVKIEKFTLMYCRAREIRLHSDRMCVLQWEEKLSSQISAFINNIPSIPRHSVKLQQPTN